MRAPVIRVAVAGALGRMGREICAAVSAEADLALVGGFARAAGADLAAEVHLARPAGRIYDDVGELYAATSPDVVVDVTVYPTSLVVAREAVARGVSPVIGATGWTEEDETSFASLCDGAGVGAAIVPNFALGAVLAMRFAEQAARYFPTAEIVELHHDRKIDKPSGTARLTARRVSAAAGRDVPIHSVRLRGLVAHQETIFGGEGETLTIRHDSLAPHVVHGGRAARGPRRARAARARRRARALPGAGVRLAIVGATGVVGETILRVLDERAIPVDELGAFASRDRAEPLRYRERDWPIRAANADAIRAGRYDAVFFASSDDASAELAEACAASGAVVIDNSATFRMTPGVPLVVPEVNPDAAGPEHRIFPVANCTAIVLCVALAPVARAAGLRSVRVATYQAVSGAGRAGLDALDGQERAAPGGGAAAGDGPFVAPIFRNVVPQIGSLDAAGDTGEEKKVAAETRKMLGLPSLHVAATTVRVPVRYAHSEAVFLETERDATVAELAAALEAAPGVVYHATGVVTPRDVEGQDLVHVARLRAEDGSARHFQLWVVGDQVRKGAATNAVQILELLIARGRFARSESVR